MYCLMKKNNGTKTYESRLISIRFLPQHWKLIQWKNNGARKGIDNCYNLNIYILGVFFSYANFDYNERWHKRVKSANINCNGYVKGYCD
jgi:hypothetical protein